MKITIGCQIVPWHGDYKKMQEQWIKAEEEGAEALYTSDHFFAQSVTGEQSDNRNHAPISHGHIFEAMTLQAAMAATTQRAEIGCLVHAIGFRNPNLLADMARTIDHISGGRFILGLGSGYQVEEYVEYGYDNFGTAKNRLEDLANAVPVIRSRFEKLNPPPLRKLPILIAAQGEKIGLRIVAQHADKWHVYGPFEKIARKTEALRNICSEIGRDFSEIELTTWFSPDVLEQKVDPGEYVKLGIHNIIAPTLGPDWDLGLLRELLQWRRDFVRARSGS